MLEECKLNFAHFEINVEFAYLSTLDKLSAKKCLVCKLKCGCFFSFEIPFLFHYKFDAGRVIKKNIDKNMAMKSNKIYFFFLVIKTCLNM